MKKIINILLLFTICIMPVDFKAQSESEPDSNLVIEHLKLQNAQLDRLIIEKAKNQNEVVKIKLIEKAVPKEVEKVYLRMEGTIYEFDIKRIKGMLIIEVDSLYATTLEQGNYKGNIFERIFYRKINK